MVYVYFVILEAFWRAMIVFYMIWNLSQQASIIPNKCLEGCTWV